MASFPLPPGNALPAKLPGCALVDEVTGRSGDVIIAIERSVHATSTIDIAPYS
jgi:hypothetical protein